jgi:hypothetical protein
MDPAVCAELERTLTAEGPEAAVDRLCARLRDQKDYHGLFYALLLRARHRLGLNPVPTAPSAEVPADKQAAYEDAIRTAGREVGGHYLAEGQIPQAWAYFRMLNEPEPIRRALEAHTPQDGEDLQDLVQIAFTEGVHPRKGFDWVLQRYGLCSAITTASSQEQGQPPEVRAYCVRALVRALYAELRERLSTEITRREATPPLTDLLPPDSPDVVRRLIEDRGWLFEEDAYHIDMSHLSSVVQMSLSLPDGAELGLARELCLYGKGLNNRFQHPGDPPFEDLYGSHDRYLSILTGEDVEGGLDYFRAQADAADPETVGTYPAEVLVNLLLKLGRDAEALTTARKYLGRVFMQRLTCPNLLELCLKQGDFECLAEVARIQGDAVHLIAGLIGARKGSV